MPNHCANKLTITGDKIELTAFMEKAKLEEGECNSFIEQLLPMPADLKDTKAPNTDEESCEIFLKKYGVTNWYDWATVNWGTKWADYKTKVDLYEEDMVIIFFTSAWNPPEIAIAAISKMFPNLSFTVAYQEPGMCFEGYAEYENGTVGQQSCETYEPRFKV